MKCLNGNYGTCNVILAGTNGVRLNDAGYLLLGVASTYTGDTEIDRGTTYLANSSVIPNTSVLGRSGNVIFTDLNGSPGEYGRLDLGRSIQINGLSSADGGTITTSSNSVTLTVGDNNQSGTFAGLIQNGGGTVGLTKIGTGTQSLTNMVHSYTGPTTINGGTLALKGAASISSSSTITAGAGGTFDVSGVSFPPYLIVYGQTLGGAGGAINGDVNVDSGALLALTYAKPVPSMNVSSGTLTLNGNATTVSIAGSPIGDGSYKLISKSGTGVVAGSPGPVTVAGAGIVGGGTPSLSLSGGELYLVVSGGTTIVEWGSGNGTWAVGVSGWNSGGSATYQDGYAALFADAYSTGNPVIALNSEVLPQTVAVNTTNSYTISGSGSIGGATDLRKLGTGALTLAVANTYTGGSALFGGTLNLNNASALGAAYGTFAINGGALDNTSGSALTTLDYPQTWNSNFTFTGSSDLNLGLGAVTMAASRTITVNSNTLTAGGDITGLGFSLIKAGAGTLALNGALWTDTGSVTVNGGTLALAGNNTFTGGVTINSGEIIVNSAGALNSTTFNTVTMPDTSASKILSLNGNSVTIADLSQSGTANLTAAVVRNNHPTAAANLRINVSGSPIFIGTIADGGAAPLALTKTGGGTLKLGNGGAGAGNYTYSGDTVINGGTLAAGAANVLPHGLGKGNILIVPFCVLDMVDRTAITLNGLYGGGKVTHSANTAGGILFVGESGADGSFTGLIVDGSAVAPFVGLTKLGTGTQMLSGTNGYTGPTLVSAGTLLVNSPGSIKASANAVTVNANATLGGSGVIHPSVMVNAGGTISAGANSVGVLTLGGALNLSAGGTNVWELGALKDDVDGIVGTDFDQVWVGGTLTLGGASTLAIKFTGTATAPDASEPFWQTAHNWTIVSATGAAATVATIQNAVYPAGTFTTSAQATGIVLTFTPGSAPIPTPVSSFSIVSGPGANLTLSYAGGTGSQFVLLQRPRGRGQV
ncbi:MAG: autotransporter-associated beta strand repeat-containing protein [Verrucomicrobia bacterium]|nr:autotransporter-associated beta strand repeat-containing protein [Verrucomicrobiota bacterium]